MKKWISLICILIISLFALQPLFSKGYFPMHDDTQVARVIVMGKALKDGQFPVRMVSDLGYGLGYPIFNFYGPLPYYVGGALYAVGVESVVATKIMFGIGAILAPMALFLFLSPIFGNMAAVVAATLFLFAPYHAVQLYIRGSVGEYWAIAFVPLVLYGFFRALREKKVGPGIRIGALSLAAVITSHTISGFLVVGVICICMLFYWTVLILQKKWTKENVIRPVVLVVIGLLLSAFFWLPAFVEMQFTSVSQMVSGARTTFFDHFVCLSQFWNSPWGFAGSAPGCIDGMSFKFGKLHILLAAMSLLIWVLLWKNKRTQTKNVGMGVAVIALLVLVFLMLPVSAPVWRLVPYTTFIQYPWRLLVFGMMAIAICGAYSVSVIRLPIVRIGVSLGIILVTIIVNAKLFVPQYQYEQDSKTFESFEELRFTKSKISDEYLPRAVAKPNSASEVVKTTLLGTSPFLVRRLETSSTRFFAELESEGPQKVTIYKAWFPGWTIFVNGSTYHPQIERGMPTVTIPGGMSIIEMRFIDTLVRIIANIMSIVGIIFLGGLYIYGKKANA